MAEVTRGAIIAGGRSVRYGAPKALATVGGVRIIDRVLAALHDVPVSPLLIANQPELFADLGVPVFPDVVTDAGALGGILTALQRAHDDGASGILAVACDMPFLSSALLRTLVATADARAADVVIPESDGPRGLEPMCAYYRVSCIAAIERALAEGNRRLVGFHGDVVTHRLGADAVARFGDPARLFLNVNTPEERLRADQLAEMEA